MSWRRSTTVLALGLLALASACADDEAGSPAEPAPSVTSDRSATDADRTASIYAAVIRELVTKENTLGSARREFLSARARRVTVGNSLWRNGLAGQWLTYVLSVRGGAWTVVGTTGPVAIS